MVPPFTACSQQKARPTAHRAEARKHIPRLLNHRRPGTKGYNTHRSELPSHPTVSIVSNPSWHAPGISAHGNRKRRRPQRPKIVPDGGPRPPAESNRVPCWLHSLPFKRFHVLFNSLFKVLFIFPSWYLFAIGLVPIFSFTWGIPRILGCNPKQPDSSKTPRATERPAKNGILTLSDMLFQAT